MVSGLACHAAAELFTLQARAEPRLLTNGSVVNCQCLLSEPSPESTSLGHPTCRGDGPSEDERLRLLGSYLDAAAKEAAVAADGERAEWTVGPQPLYKVWRLLLPSLLCCCAPCLGVGCVAQAHAEDKTPDSAARCSCMSSVVRRTPPLLCLPLLQEPVHSTHFYPSGPGAHAGAASGEWYGG